MVRRLLADAPWPARNPDANLADLKAQVAANMAGARDFAALVARHGLPEVSAYMAHVLDNGEAAVRAVLSKLRGGTFETRLDDGRLALEDDGIAQRLSSIKADCMAIRAMTLADIAETDRTGMPGPKGSMMKLMVTATHKALSEVVGEILGWSFLEFDGDRSAHPWTYDYLWSWIFSISGGTNEIQREITADRILALPRGR